MNILAEDVLIEILIRLPVKSLMRFRCISRYWYALINSPYFVTAHLKRDCKDAMVLLKRRPSRGEDHVLSLHCLDSPDLLVSPSLSIPPIDDLVRGDCYDFFGTCNGLVCLVVSNFNDDRESTSFAVILCNPALREFKVLDHPNPNYSVSLISGCGFGFDANTNAYKVVLLWDFFGTEYEDLYPRVDLYDSSTNSWRLIDAAVPGVEVDCPECDLFLNGACHWYTISNNIISFNLSTEVFQQFEYPDHLIDDDFTDLVVLNQCLSLVHYTERHFDLQVLDIWVMKEYGVKESWTKVLAIGPYVCRRPLLFLKNEWLLVETRHNYQLASFALRGNEVKRFNFYGECMEARIFTECLVSLK